MVISLEDFHRALSDDELVPHFQPIAALRTGALAGFEVLARWSHRVHGEFLPSNLIELAETNGLIDELCEQVFSKAFAAFAAAPEHLRLSINVLPAQFETMRLPRFLQRLAEAANFSLTRLTVEMTESALVQNLRASEAACNELKELGCRLSLDDFGTGYSSLAHLQSLPFDELKIDRSFVSKMSNRRESRKIVAAIIGLGNTLGLSTVAEGIETAAQSDILLWLGCELGQGWHFGRPSPFHIVPTIIAKSPRPAAPGLATPGEDWAVSSLEALPTLRLAQLQAIYDGAPIGLCFTDCDFRFVSLNQKLADMNGLSVAEHLGRTVQEVMPELLPHVETYLARVLRGEAISDIEVPRPRLAPGGSGWILCSYQPAFDEADDVIGISISVLDISEKKKAELDLKESEFVQSTIIEISGQTLWTMDASGTNLQMSSAWVQTQPESRNHVRNLGWLEAVHAQDLKATIRKMKKAVATGQPVDMEYRIQGTDGQWRWMRSRGLPRFAKSGEVIRWYGTFEDIHERKSLELEVKRADAKLRAARQPARGASSDELLLGRRSLSTTRQILGEA
jgi:PAS domain S-box-containing protein